MLQCVENGCVYVLRRLSSIQLSEQNIDIHFIQVESYLTKVTLGRTTVQFIRGGRQRLLGELCEAGVF